jgi:hypothetical protein
LALGIPSISHGGSRNACGSLHDGTAYHSGSFSGSLVICSVVHLRHSILSVALGFCSYSGSRPNVDRGVALYPLLDSSALPHRLQIQQLPSCPSVTTAGAAHPMIDSLVVHSVSCSFAPKESRGLPRARYRCSGSSLLTPIESTPACTPSLNTQACSLPRLNISVASRVLIAI